MSFNTTMNTQCNYIKTTENEPFRVIIKITGLIAHGLYLILAIFFKLLSNLLLIVNSSLGLTFLTLLQIGILRSSRWSAFIVDSIALYTFNPLIKDFFKDVWKKLKYFICQWQN
jgi:hypothetical protein